MLKLPWSVYCVSYFESHYWFGYVPDLIKYSEGHLMTSKLGQNNVPFGGLAFGMFPALFCVGRMRKPHVSAADSSSGCNPA